MNILGISAFYHDSAAALIADGEVIAAAQEERFTRKKYDASFPEQSVRYCLDYAGCSLKDLDAVVFYDKPMLKFERLLETYYHFAPKGLGSFISSMPVWIKEKLFQKKLLIDSLKKIESFRELKPKLLFTEHHLSHAASTYYPSPFDKAAIITIDGVGEWATASICLGERNNITILKQLDFPHSLGLLYSAFTYYLGFKVNSGEYKMMGLAPYGNNGLQVAHYINLIKQHLVDIKKDGSLFLNMDYFNYAVGFTMVKEKKWEKLFGFPKRSPESALEQHHCDLALAAQEVTEEIVLKLAEEARRLTSCENLCLAGGVALNCVANGKVDDAGIFKNIFITPASGDAGGALGAALAGYHIYFNQEKATSPKEADKLKGSYLGPAYTNEEVLKVVRKYKASAVIIPDEDELLEMAAELLAQGNVIGWHQGRMEFGPRALGARSIIADARNEEMQKKLNLKIKFREGFLPFAPIVPVEEVEDYFEHSGASPYMLLVKQVKKKRQIPYPADFGKKDLLDRLYFLRSDIPAVTHIDYSARLQTVHKDTNERLWKLLMAFKKLTGYPVLVNTSFNVRGEPIVNTPEDAYRCFMRTEMDYLFASNVMFDKQQQPTWKEHANWKAEFTLD
jgi:carbamoyltransferase